MKKTLIELLGLPDAASDDDVIKAVKALTKQADQAKAEAGQNAAINKRVAASGGALDHARAAQVDAHQAAFDSSPIGKQFKKAARK